MTVYIKISGGILKLEYDYRNIIISKIPNGKSSK